MIASLPQLRFAVGRVVSTRRSARRPLLVLALLGSLAGCARLGPLGPGLDGALWRDARGLASGDLGGPGPLQVEAVGISVSGRRSSFDAALYRPEGEAGPLPAVVFLPGYLAPEDQYEGYARALASHGILTAVHARFSPFVSDQEMVDAASEMADWLVADQAADPKRLGIAGHSMGGKAAVLAAAADPRFRAVVSIDPDDRGELPVDGALARLGAPLLLIGAEAAWKAADICASRDHNYERFFETAPPGTLELTLLGADHVQLMDDPDAFGLGLCRSGSADSRTVRVVARRAVVSFFLTELAGEPAQPLDLSGIGRIETRS
jgi:dienelactone hydrolase